MITLGTLALAHGQEVFNQVAIHLLTQMESSSTTHGCVYRTTKEGKSLSCAAGCLISDDEIKLIERKGLNGVGWYELVGNDVAPKNHRELISNLQTIHDSYNTEDWEYRLRELAIKHGFTFPII